MIISVLEEDIDIQITIDELRKLECERLEIENQVNDSLKELGFVVLSFKFKDIKK